MLIQKNGLNGKMLLLAIGSLACSGTLPALKDPENQGRWSKACTTGPDAVVPGFLVNMGPTGSRGVLKERSFVVKHIFKDSPSFGILELDDEVYGANGKKFSEHTFGGNKHGIEGPIQDLGLAIEDSEGEDGVLELMVSRGDDKLELKVQLEALGRFEDSFPIDCKKTEILKARAYQYLIDNPGEIDSQARCVATLALLSSDDKKVFQEGKKMALDWNKPYNETTWSWHLGFQGIALAEYHLLTGDRKVLRTLESTMDLLREAQWQTPINHYKAEKMKNPVEQSVLDEHQARYEGGFGHAPYSVIVNRGGGGYGPMQWPTCLALMTWTLGKECGIEVTHPGIEKGFQFLNYGTTDAGKIAYGGEFTLNNGPVDSEQWKKSQQNKFSHKSGLGYLVHMLASQRSESESGSDESMKLHLSNIDAAYKDMPDGHACAMMGMTWGLAGVYASDDTKLQEKISNYYKAWLNMSRCHGSDSYVILPGRDYADSSYYRKNIRNHTTAAVAFIYSYSTPKCRIQGHTGGEIKETESKGLLTDTNEGELRVFHNADRSGSFEGRLVAFDHRLGLVRVRLKKNGRINDLDFSSLSEEDRNYLIKHAEKTQ